NIPCWNYRGRFDKESTMLRSRAAAVGLAIVGLIVCVIIVAGRKVQHVAGNDAIAPFEANTRQYVFNQPRRRKTIKLRAAKSPIKGSDASVAPAKRVVRNNDRSGSKAQGSKGAPLADSIAPSWLEGESFDPKKWLAPLLPMGGKSSASLWLAPLSANV